ncbi:MAG: ABC transporter ATP-binding protein [Actinobacteria bacterium]|nr:ABC transporter ATP-binding protein [Actinomycetota bacterium]
MIGATVAGEVAPAGAGSSAPALEGRAVCKNYGGLRAVIDVSFGVAPGEILGIVGPNGAGKTTLFDVITGHTSATSGEVILEGRPIVGEKVHTRCALGLARTFQQPTVAASLSVLENLYLASSFRRRRENGAQDVAVAERWLEFAGLTHRASAEAGPLGVFDKKRLMLATALATNPIVLLLDEPFGGLNPQEIDSVMGLIRAVRDQGLAVVCIEHVMRALTALADRVLVMHHGATFFEGTPGEMLADERVIEVYLGSAHGGHT